MFKRTALASSLLALAGATQAATLATGVAPIHTKQGLLTAAVTDATTANYKLTLGAEYAAGDTITFDYSIAMGPSTTLPSTIACDDNGTTTASKTDVVTFGLLNNTTTAATYRVTDLKDGGAAAGITTTGLVCITPQITLDPAALAATAGATMTFSAATGTGVALDTTAAPTKDIAKTVDEFTVGTITKFNGIINVNDTKLSFTDGAANNSPDALSYTTAEATGTAGVRVTKAAAAAAATAAQNPQTATLASLVTTVTGSTGFNWLDEDATTAGIQVGTDNTITDTDGNSAITYTTDGTGIVLTTASDNEGANVLTVKKGVATTTIPAQTYSASTVFTWDTNQTTTVAWDAGSWTLNAASITAYAVPMSSSVTRMMWVANNGSSSGDITATVTGGGSSYGPYALGSVAAKSQTYISTLLDTALSTAGVSLTGRANVQVDVTAPTQDIVLTAAYKVDSAGDRLHLETSDTLEDVITVSGTINKNTGCVGTGSLVVDGTASGQIKAAVTAKSAVTDDGALLTYTDIDCGAGGGSVSTTTVAK